jgi:EAL domain-containing protein (putative c-di-GMP-specific phosphodiesterase class I)
VVTDTEPTFALVGAPFLEYLPVVDLSTGRLLGMEALVRWQHPTHGLISPTRLLPHAEVSGDIGPLTRWILMEACEKACNWSPSIQLGVNCSIHQLRRGEVSKAVARALDLTGFRSGQLTLEVTEDAIVDSSASADLKTLSDMGVQLSVDDVGTNWSSFEPFKRNSISTVKIDGSFIAGLESTQGINRLVVETVIHMAHSLGMSAIVEWVETAAQVEIVRAFNADAAQGFFFAVPMSSDEAVAFAAGPEIPQFSLTETRASASSRDTGMAGPDAGPADADADGVDSRSGWEAEDEAEDLMEDEAGDDANGEMEGEMAGEAADDQERAAGDDGPVGAVAGDGLDESSNSSTDAA